MSIFATRRHGGSAADSELWLIYNETIDIQQLVALNRTIALGYTEGSSKGITALKSLKGLEQNPFYYVALDNFFQKRAIRKPP